jgi:hypothetical protein
MSAKLMRDLHRNEGIQKDSPATNRGEEEEEEKWKSVNCVIEKERTPGPSVGKRQA